MKFITIPATIEFIYQEAFADCNSLECIKVLPEIPPFLYEDSFSKYSIQLKVPKGRKETYQSAPGWKNFTNISDSYKYRLIYMVDGEEYKSYDIEEGEAITPAASPTKEGYTFSGWSEIPETMPAHDVTVSGSFTVNKYQITYIINGEVYSTESVEYGATIIPPTVEDKEGYTFSCWADVPDTMPAHDITIYGNFTSGIVEISIDNATGTIIYSINGKRVNKLQRGVNIVRTSKGEVKKVIVK